MKRIICKFFLYILFLWLVWLVGWLLVRGWYNERFANSYEPILNGSAGPAIITAVVCLVIETLLSSLAVNPALVLLIMFVLRIALMLGLSAVAFVIVVSGENTGKYDMISFVLTGFCFYGALLSAYVIGNVVVEKLTEKQNI